MDYNLVDYSVAIDAVWFRFVSGLIAPGIGILTAAAARATSYHAPTASSLHVLDHERLETPAVGEFYYTGAYT